MPLNRCMGHDSRGSLVQHGLGQRMDSAKRYHHGRRFGHQCRRHRHTARPFRQVWGVFVSFPGRKKQKRRGWAWDTSRLCQADADSWERSPFLVGGALWRALHQRVRLCQDNEATRLGVIHTRVVIIEKGLSAVLLGLADSCMCVSVHPSDPRGPEDSSCV